jgi:ribonuclease HI
MANSTKFYAVWRGHKPGVYDSWLECKAQIDGYQGAQYKAFPNKAQAELALKDSYWKHVQIKGKSVTKTPNIHSNALIKNSICVDAACSGNPGILEYRAVDTVTREEIFRRGPFPEGTNNLGEFLALVHGISYLQRNNLTKSIYSDSATAIAWFRNKKVKTKLELNGKNKELLELVQKAESYLHNNTISIEVLKWPTESWGEIPADFGRK